MSSTTSTSSSSRSGALVAASEGRDEPLHAQSRRGVWQPDDNPRNHVLNVLEPSTAVLDAPGGSSTGGGLQSASSAAGAQMPDRTVSSHITDLLGAWREGNQEARDHLIDAVYAELRRLAHHHLRRERPGHTLQTTALVHDAYLQLVEQRNVHWQGRAPTSTALPPI